MSREKLQGADPLWRAKLHEVIFEADTLAGRTFDLVLILSISLSVMAVIFDSVPSVHDRWGDELYIAEWVFTILFLIEYILRIASVKKPSHYIFSFFGLVDVLAILPTFVSIIVPGSQYLLVIRILRVLRIFRVLKLATYLKEVKVLSAALHNSRRKITVFLFTVVTLVVILGSLMYLIEGEQSGFTSIPEAIYWAIVTLTTVGYGDISPTTPIGKAFSAIIMILGYAIIAVPTGIVTVELSRAGGGRISTRACESCGGEGHDLDAVHCKHCGAKL